MQDRDDDGLARERESGSVKTAAICGPVVANGAALVALVGLIGDLNEPDAALSLLTWPLVALACGLASGYGGLDYDQQALDCRTGSLIFLALAFLLFTVGNTCGLQLQPST